MIPSSLNIIVIGYKTPPIVDYCLTQNELICKEFGVNMIVHHPARDYIYPTPGIQAESIKLMIHTRMINAMVIDWDIHLKDFPEVESSEYPYLGEMPDGRNDLFLSYCTTPACHDIIDKWIDCFENINSLPHSYGTGISFTNYFRKFTHKYPERAFVHYRTNCGFHTIKDSYGELPPEKRNHLDIVSKISFTSGGNLWPI